MDNTYTLKEEIGRLIDTGKAYAEERIELEVLKAVDRISRFFAMLLTLVLAAGLTGLILLFVFAGLAMVVNQWLDSSFWGFFIISGLCALILLMLFTLGRKQIRQMVTDFIIKNMDND